MGTTHRIRSWVWCVAAGVLLGLANWFAPQVVLLLGTPNLNPFIEFPANPWIRLLAQWPVYLLWLVPAFSVALLEAHRTRRSTCSALAVVLLWLSAMVTYYAIYSGNLLLGFGGDQLLVRLDEGWATYWQDVYLVRAILQDILQDFVLWGSVAIVTGAAFGWIVGCAMLMRIPASRR